MVVRKLKGKAKQSISVAMAAMMVATSMPQTATATEMAENETAVVEQQTEESSEKETDTEESSTEESTTDTTESESSTEEGTEQETEETTEVEETVVDETVVEETESVETEETEVATEEKTEVEKEESSEEDIVEAAEAEEDVEVQATSYEDASMTFVAGTDAKWTDKVFASNDITNYPDAASIDVTLTGDAKVTATVTVDGSTEALTDKNAIQLACAVKAGDSWTYYKSADYSWIQAGNFVDGKAEVTFTKFATDDEAKIALAGGKIEEIVFQYNIEGSADSYTGNITLSNVKIENVASEEDNDEDEDKKEDTSSGAVYESTTVVTAENVDFSALAGEDWENGKVTVAYATTNDIQRNVNANYKVSAKITIDESAYNTLSVTEDNYIKFQGVVKLGDNWTYTTGDTWPMLKASDFEKDGDNYSATIQIDYKDKAGVLMEIDFEIVGVGFKGNINISDVTVTNEAVKYEVVVYENTASVASPEIDYSALASEDWENGKTSVVYTNAITDAISLGNNYKVKSKITINEAAYNTLNASADNYIKFQGVVKLGDNWTYTTGDTWPMLKAADFEKSGDNYTAEIEVEYIDKSGVLREIDYEIVGAGFKGIVNISDVTVIDVTTEQPPLEEKDPTVISDLSTADDFAKWTTEEGYNYYHGGTVNSVPALAYDADNQQLKVSLDYSANSKDSWSEAKVKYVAAEAVDVSQYNQISVDITYPAELSGPKMKFFSEGVINKDLAIDESKAVALENGMKKVTVTAAFSPNTKPLESVTIGIIGVSTSFKGDVYLDNLKVSQKDVTEDFVKITSVPGAGSPANITGAPATVKLTDANADDSAEALFAYLSALAKNNQVLFGHQNDVSRSVNPKAEFGDVYDVTGQVSGLFGLDSLALTGSEAGGTDSKTALENSVKYSKEAASKGAIITLSTHMPNFSNSKIIKNEDGTYDFFQCNFDESKDLSNDIAKKILPGGEYNEVYRAYLDIVVDYATQLQNDNIPIIFRPLHENTGSWFWWGSTNTAETYQSLFRYTKDYIESKGVHNMLWVYSPNGPLTSKEEYLSYYPGDEYVDILAFDYYDDYNSYPASYSEDFFKNMDKTCEVISSLAAERGKIPAISECGVRVMKADGSNNDGLLVKGNPVGTQAAEDAKNWYSEIDAIANKYNMPYYLVWANFSDTNFYAPYKYNDEYGHELINDFIDYYNLESSIFGADTNFYSSIEALANGTQAEDYTDKSGYIVTPFDMATILEPTKLKAMVKNAIAVQFVVEDTATGTKVTIDAVEDTNASVGTSKAWVADLTTELMSQVGKTDVAAITLLADGTELAKITNISLGQEKATAPANVFENFDFYSGSDGLLDTMYTPNSAAGCSSSFILDSENKADGSYGGAFRYVLETSGSEVWTGRVKGNLVSNDFSEYNALQMWVKPDGKGQKLVVQLVSNGEDFEAYLTEFVKGTEAQYVTIPFSSLKGKNGGTFDPSNVNKFAIWCNSIIPEGHTGTWKVDSTIYFDAIQAIKLTDEQLSQNPVDENGLIVTNKDITAPKEGLWFTIEGGNNVTYTGKAIKPEIKVYDGEKLLKNKKDYTVIYSNNINASTADSKAKITVKGKGNYSDILEKEFTINKKDVNDLAISVSEFLAVKANNAEQNIKITVKDGKKSLKTADYTVKITLNDKEVEKATEEGTYKIEITGNGNYTGTVTKECVVTKKTLLTNAKITLPSKSLEYNEGNEVKFADETKIVVKVKGKTVDAANYTVTYENNKEVGKATVVITAKADSADYVGSCTKTFDITGIKFNTKNVVINGFANKVTYDGNEKLQKLTLKDKAGNDLTAGKDYEITYSADVVNAGKATVTIKGMGKYTGSIKKSYTINKAVLTSEMVSTVVEAQEQNRAGATPDVKITYNNMTLVNGVDYTLSYKNNKNITTADKKATITVKGKGNYTGQLKNVVKFDIVAKSLADDDVEVVISDMKYSANKAEYKPTVVVYDNGKKLKANKDYKIVEYKDNKKENVDISGDGIDTASVIIKGEGDYNDANATNVEVSFDITENMIKDAKVSLKEGFTPVYAPDGNVAILKENLEVTFGKGDNKATLTADDYEIISVVQSSNGKKVSITIDGRGKFGGYKTVTFKLGARNMKTSVSDGFAKKISEIISKMF